MRAESSSGECCQGKNPLSGAGAENVFSSRCLQDRRRAVGEPDQGRADVFATPPAGWTEWVRRGLLSERLSQAMKFCPQCMTGFPDRADTCPTHGGFLSEIVDLKPGMTIRITTSAAAPTARIWHPAWNGGGRERNHRAGSQYRDIEARQRIHARIDSRRGWKIQGRRGSQRLRQRERRDERIQEAGVGPGACSGRQDQTHQAEPERRKFR